MLLVSHMALVGGLAEEHDLRILTDWEHAVIQANHKININQSTKNKNQILSIKCLAW